MVFFEQISVTRAKVVVLGQKWFYSVKRVFFGHFGSIWVKVILFKQRWLCAGSVVVFGQKWLY